MSGDERGLGENEKRSQGLRRKMNEGGAATLHYTPREGPPEARHLLRPEPGDTEMRPELSRSSSSFHHTALLSLDASPKRTSAPLRFPPKNPLSPKHR